MQFIKKLGAQLTSSLLAVLLAGCGCATGSTKQLLVLNILDAELYQDCHIPGSVNVPFETLESYAQKLSHDQEIVVYCANYACTASKMAAEQLAKMGFKHVYAYEAGMAGWLQSKLPVNGPAKERYLTRTNEAPAAHDGSINVIETAELAAKLGLK